MEIKDFKQLDDFYLDVLKEVGNIGAGNAATALAKLMGKKIVMDVPDIKIIEFKEVNEMFDNAERPVVGVLVKVAGDLPSYVMLIMEYETAKLILNVLLGISPDSEKAADSKNNTDELTDLELSAIMEVGNILTGSYLSALSELTGLNAQPSVPAIAIDMVGAILSVPAIELGKICDTVLYIESRFSEGSTNIKTDFILIPTPESYQILMKTLGVGN